jgi:hypothetical protein
VNPPKERKKPKVMRIHSQVALIKDSKGKSLEREYG